MNSRVLISAHTTSVNPARRSPFVRDVLQRRPLLAPHRGSATAPPGTSPRSTSRVRPLRPEQALAAGRPSLAEQSVRRSSGTASAATPARCGRSQSHIVGPRRPAEDAEHPRQVRRRAPGCGRPRSPGAVAARPRRSPPPRPAPRRARRPPPPPASAGLVRANNCGRRRALVVVRRRRELIGPRREDQSAPAGGCRSRAATKSRGQQIEQPVVRRRIGDRETVHRLDQADAEVVGPDAVDEAAGEDTRCPAAPASRTARCADVAAGQSPGRRAAAAAGSVGLRVRQSRRGAGR